MPRKATKGSFKKGDPRAGRPPGALNKATVEIREAARKLLDDPIYQQNLQQRLQDGTAGPIEALLYYYAHGKPKETVEHQTTMRPVVIDLLQPGDIQSDD